MTYQQFKTKWIGRRVNFDGVYGFQSGVKVGVFSFLPRLNRLLHSFKKTENDNLIIDANSSLPLTTLSSKSNASNTTSVVCPNLAISYVGSVADSPKIRPSVVKRITTYVVNIKPFRGIHNPAVKLHEIITRKSLLEVGSAPLNHDTPSTAKLFEPYESFIIDNSFKSSMSFGSKSYSFHNISLSNDSQKVKV